MPARAALAGPGELPGLRPGPDPARTSTRCSPGTRRRPAPGCTRAPPSPARCSTTAPAGSSACAAEQARATDAADVPRAAGGRRRRHLVPALAGDGPAQARRPAAGRRGPPLLHAARGTTTTTWSPGWSCGTADATAAARLRLDLRARRRHGQRRPRHAQLLRAPSARSTTGRCCAAGWTARPRSGADRGERDGADPRRGAADGLQPAAALHPRAAAGRRRRRHGQPVQRRGHRLRDGVRRARRRGRRAGAGPAGPPAARAGAARLPDGAEGRATAATTARPGAS